MARAAKKTIWIVLACVAAPGFVVSPAGAAERIAMVGFAAETPGPVGKAKPRGKSDAAAPVHSRNGARTYEGYETPRRRPITYRPRRLAKALRVDLSRFQVTRPAADERPAHPTGWAVPKIIHIGVKRGVMPGAKAVGVEMPVAPYVAVEGRLGSDGESDMAIRFRLRY